MKTGGIDDGGTREEKMNGWMIGGLTNRVNNGSITMNHSSDVYTTLCGHLFVYMCVCLCGCVCACVFLCLCLCVSSFEAMPACHWMGFVSVIV